MSKIFIENDDLVNDLCSKKGAANTQKAEKCNINYFLQYLENKKLKLAEMNEKQVEKL